MNNKKLSTKNPLESTREIHTYWIKATCDSRLCALDASEQKRTLWNSQTDCQDTAPLTGTRLPRTQDLCFNFVIFLWNRICPPMKTRINFSKHSEATCVRDAWEESAIYLDNLSGQKCALSKTCQWTLRRSRDGLCILLVDCFAEESHFLKHGFGNAAWCSRHLPWAYVSLHLIGGFLLWAMNNHLNKKTSTTAIRLCARCTLEESC